MLAETCLCLKRPEIPGPGIPGYRFNQAPVQSESVQGIPCLVWTEDLGPCPSCNFRDIPDMIEMAVGKENGIRFLNIRRLEGLNRNRFQVATQIRVNQENLIHCSDLEPCGSHPCNFHFSLLKPIRVRYIICPRICKVLFSWIGFPIPHHILQAADKKRKNCIDKNEPEEY
jgi:hypothetical protein